MIKINPVIKIGCVFLVCVSVAYVNYVLFTAFNFIEDIKKSTFLVASALCYLAVIFFFANYYRKKKMRLILVVWLILNVAFCTNFLVSFSGETTPLYLQYSQSTSLFIYAVLLITTKDNFPNWLRLFSLACLLMLIPCLIYYFAQIWTYYEYSVYMLCFTPIIKSFVFLKEIKKDNVELLDAI